MDAIKYFFLLGTLSAVAVSALGAPDDTNPATEIKTDAEKPRDLFGDLFSGMDIKVDQFVSQGTKVIQKVTQSQTAGGHTVVKTEVTEFSGTNPAGFRFKRDLFDQFMDNVDNKMEAAHQKLAGAVATGVNMAYDAKNKVHQVLQQH